MAVVAVSIEGVLSQPSRSQNFHSQTFAASAPIPEGVRLLTALKGGYEVALLSCESDAERVNWWLKQQSLTEFYGLLLVRTPIQAGLGYADLRAAQQRALRASGRAPALVVDTSPAVVSSALRLGIPAMLYAHPTYQRPEFRPDHDAGRTWLEIQTETERLNVLKRSDVRLQPLEHAEAAEAEFEEVET